MTLTQKLPFLILFNASMILRSVSRRKSDKRVLSENYKNRKISLFRKETFKQFYKLAKKIDNSNLKRVHIHNSIRSISKKTHTSFGQAQKGLNVLLKYYCHLFYYDSRVMKELDCPLDKFILDSLDKSIFLNHITEKYYLEIQNNVSTGRNSRIAYDYKWDKKKIHEAKI